ncbi:MULTISPECIES: helix-turn-helix transcriptional regulator [Amycolatopsis]|uniref:Helix-turn-helix domain-containing protein n=1 Tax=Amycolatopsis tucumanensis TaxID=401106 RepID=A0ABP7I650_9PSEU|nr:MULTISPECIES: helix-turn-helix domain-containing protein [Amycolatopsis]MCF6428743.1 helix-turn-helix domain-containing protein [Amycolatopsis tucumanensis]
MPLGRWSGIAHPELDEITVDDVLHALADPTRRAIIRLLQAEGDRPCGTFGLPVAASTLSHHFRALRKGGLIRQYDEGRQRMNTLRTAELEQKFPGLVDAVLANAE